MSRVFAIPDDNRAKTRDEVSHRRAFAHLCNKSDMQEIFLESGGLKILIDVLVNHAWNKTGHKFSEKGVSFSRPGINTTGIRRYF